MSAQDCRNQEPAATDPKRSTQDHSQHRYFLRTDQFKLLDHESFDNNIQSLE